MNKRVEFELFLGRLTMAIFGGIFLIGPMWLMVLKPGLYISLISTSVCVVIFSLALAYFLKKESMVTVVGAAAAYAAVLVVFVGTTTTS